MEFYSQGTLFDCNSPISWKIGYVVMYGKQSDTYFFIGGKTVLGVQNGHQSSENNFA